LPQCGQSRSTRVLSSEEGYMGVEGAGYCQPFGIRY
jgi:hypothetical protein